MKYIFIHLVLFFTWVEQTLAADPQNITGLSNEKLRNGDIHAEDIPGVIRSAIDFFMNIAGTITVIFIIIWAYKILFWSLQQDKTKGRDTIIMALGGFALASLAWVIIKLVLSNF